jgi:topoisomerase-4 subunit A
MQVDLEEFIAIKGINALGNQLTKEKINQINLLDPLPFEAPEEVHAEDLNVVDAKEVKEDTAVKSEEASPNEDSQEGDNLDETGQASLF